ncbi:MAG: YidC/Oxa1 family membrane protein insertase [Firmicutes bacterium]|nr:YidC/Oxa1 family membrane protein insertase [Bacillota bacterium]
MGTIIGGIFNMLENMGVATLAMRIIIFSIALRLLLFPLDYLMRRSSRRMAKATEKIRPQLKNIQEKHKGDRARIQKETQALYKSVNYRPLSMCLPMLFPVIIMIAVWTGFNQYSTRHNEQLFENIQLAAQIEFYITEQDESVSGINGDEYIIRLATEEEIVLLNPYVEAELLLKYRARYIEIFDFYYYIYNLEHIARARARQHVALLAFEENRSGFFWITNLARPDTPWAATIESYSEYLALIDDYRTVPMTYGEFQSKMELIRNTHRRNGLVILPILAVILNIFTMLVMRRNNPQQMMPGQPGSGAMKVMLFIMPAMIGIISLQFAAGFALYITVGTATQLVTGTIINQILKRDNKDSGDDEMQFDRQFRRA